MSAHHPSTNSRDTPEQEDKDLEKTPYHANTQDNMKSDTQPSSDSESTAISKSKEKDLEHGAEDHKTTTDPNLIDWDENDPANPLNWSTAKVWCNLGIISFFRFLTPLASSMMAPVTNLILEDFKTNDQTIGSFVVSIYILGYALGPMVLAPLSEIYGRLPIYHINSALFVIWNMACALSPNINALLVFRLFAGLAGSCPVTNGNGSIADCVPREKRGKVTAIFTAGPLLGPVFGPIVGGFLGEGAGWRWIFWLLTIVSGVGTLISFCLQHETYAPILLERRVQKLKQETGNEKLHHKHSNNLTKPEIFRRAIARPLTMLFTSPIVALTSVYAGLVYGYTYLLFTSFERAFESIYNFSNRLVGLTYLGFGIGCAIGLYTIGALSDRLVMHYSKGTEWKPEYRLLPLLPGSLIVPIGLLWYGWSAEAHTHWIVPIIGTAFVGLGTLAIFMPVQSYLIDAFTLYASSAAAANTIFRSMLGAFLPLAGPSLYAALGQGWGNTLLAGIALAFTPMAWVIFRFGERIRKGYPGRVK
ncbi:Putative major facilitator superfamily, MFS transporter superfamily [Septoria linicola]|uniref:Cercosporin MFS transporter CTB4 n=1 Tax=Septoria linicola TaxID=215465 RepID=A0A9Q9B741_9PEZI|nr:putative major facilitator superfamily, MFS transporter superfamily [Septoria linicola]USW58648.1 Putative major facilitator superfamily, MFS transporter superfamily [Septoria linicola]